RCVACEYAPRDAAVGNVAGVRGSRGLDGGVFRGGAEDLSVAVSLSKGKPESISPLRARRTQRNCYDISLVGLDHRWSMGDCSVILAPSVLFQFAIQFGSQFVI